jgi:hypothetical protein
MDMQFEWLLGRQQQGQFKIYWKPGKTNLANYFMKHHPPAHHQNVQGEFLRRFKELQRLHQEQSKDMETSLVTTDKIKFPKCSARVCQHICHVIQTLSENGVKYSLLNI